MKWSGLDDWLKSQYGKRISKQDVLDFVKANQVEIKEVTKGAIESKELDNLYFERGLLRNRNQSSETIDKKIAELESKEQNTKFEAYQLPGGENYKELLLTLPDKRIPFDTVKFEDDMTAKYGTGWTKLPRSAIDAENLSKLDFLHKNIGQNQYRSPHWNEPNVLAHVRMNDRVDADGNKTLLLEEVQSDWHQEGRKKGYAKSNPTDKDIIETYNLQNPDADKIAEYRRHYVAQGLPLPLFQDLAGTGDETNAPIRC